MGKIKDLQRAAGLADYTAGDLSGRFIANLNVKGLSTRKFAKENLVGYAELCKQVAAEQLKAFGCVTPLHAEAIQAVDLDLGES